MKLFAELEIKRKEREAKEMHERYEQHSASAVQALPPASGFLREDKSLKILNGNRPLEIILSSLLLKARPWIRSTRV